MPEITKQAKIFIGGAIVLILLIIYYIYPSSNIKPLNSHFTLSNDKDKRIHLINIYASWCGWSKKMLPEWQKVEDYFKSNKDIVVQKYEESESPDSVKKFQVTGFPSIFIVKGEQISEFPPDLPRTAEHIINHVMNSK